MSQEKSPKTIAYQLRAGLQMRQFGLDHGIYDHECKQIFMLNPTAGLIFNYLSTGKSHDEIVENIVIACGENTAPTSEIKKDLEETVEEFMNLKLVEPVRDSNYVLQDPLVISENEMTSLSIPYLPPQIKAYRIEDLLDKYQNNNDRKFADTWNPDADNVRFLDTWTDIGNVRFSDTWNPDSGSVKFSDTWNPDASNVRFSDTWNPRTGNVRFLDTYNPKEIYSQISKRQEHGSNPHQDNQCTPEQ